MKSIDLLSPADETDNSQDIQVDMGATNELIGALTSKIEEVIDSQQATTEKLTQAITDVLNNTPEQEQIIKED